MSSLSGSTQYVKIPGGVFDSNYHLVRQQPAVPFLTLAAGAGAGSTGSITGSDQGMVLTVNAAGAPASPSAVCAITYNSPIAALTPAVCLTPMNANAAGLAANLWISTATTSGKTTSLQLNNNAALTAAQTYIWSVTTLG